MEETACDFLKRAIKAYLTGHELEKIDEIEIGFISDLNEITLQLHMDQPKPMFCRKMIRKFFEVKSEDIFDFEYNWIPCTFTNICI